MIIDLHTHMAFAKIYSSAFLQEMLANFTGGVSDQAGIPAGRLNLLMSAFLKDEYGDSLIRQMDHAGIDHSVLLIIDGGIGLGEPQLSLEDIFLVHQEVVKRHPGRVSVFAGVDPRRGVKGFELFKKGIEFYGFNGLKLYPPMGYRMDDERLFPYYQVCAENKLPVLIHTGPSMPILENELAEPVLIRSAAANFPNVNFVLAHAARRLFNPEVRALLSIPNIYFDISGFQNDYTEVTDDMVRKMGILFSEELNQKVLFGSDWPLFNLFTPLKNNVQLIKMFFDQCPFSANADAFQNVMYRNAVALLNR